MNKVKFWRAIAFLFVILGIVSAVMAWYGLLIAENIFGVSPEFYFYEAISDGIFGLFFLIYSVHSQQKK